MDSLHEKLAECTKKMELSSAALDYIYGAACGPSRTIGAPGRKSVLVEYPSMKMGTTVSAESRTGEYAYGILLEHDPHVIMYFEQPPAVDVRRTTKRGVSLTRYTPDFLVVRESNVEIIQVKTTSQADKLVAAGRDWKFASGGYADAAADDAFAKIGIAHRVVTTADLSQILISNLCAMERARRNYKVRAPDIEEKIIRILSRQRVMTMSSLAQEARIDDLTPIISMLAFGLIHIDMHRSLVTVPTGCILYYDKEAAESVQKPNIHDAIFNMDSLDDTLKIFSNGKSMERAIAKLKLLDKDPATLSETDKRHQRRIREALRAGEEKGQTKLEAIAPNTSLQGNRSAKRPEIVLNTAHAIAVEHYASPEQPSASTVYGRYLDEASNIHPEHQPVSRTHFYKILDSIAQDAALQRGGNRLANSSRSPSKVEERALRSTYPFELAAVDHYLMDVYVVCGTSGGRDYTARPYLSVMVDCYSGYILSFWISFKDPTKATPSQLLRQCAFNHNRIPHQLISDNGSDFRSNHYVEMAAACGMVVQFRPPGDGRSGSEVERAFGTTKSQFTDGLPGNIKSTKWSRENSPSHQPQALARLNLEELWIETAAYIEVKNSRTSGSKTQSPMAVLSEGLRRFSFAGIPTPYDLKFLVSTSLPARHIKVCGTRGLHIDDVHYWSDGLVTAAGQRIPVRRDTHDMSVVYALVGSTWLPCRSTSSQLSHFVSDESRWSTAILHLDAGSLRREMKDDSARELAKRLKDARSTEVGIRQPANTEKNEARSTSRSLFDSISIDEPRAKAVRTRDWKRKPT